MRDNCDPEALLQKQAALRTKIRKSVRRIIGPDQEAGVGVSSDGMTVQTQRLAGSTAALQACSSAAYGGSAVGVLSGGNSPCPLSVGATGSFGVLSLRFLDGRPGDPSHGS